MTKLLLYCTKAKKQKDLLWSNNLKHFFLDGAYNRIIDNLPKHLLNGKIVAECDYEVDEIFGISRGTNQPDKYDFKWKDSILNGACLTNDQMNDYMPHYAIHIKNLNIFDKPRELSDYIIKQCQYAKCSTCKYGKNNIICSTIDTPITKAPQNMMYAYDNELNKYILISIQPQWMCLILNHIKDVEVRKVVLKEMLKNE